MARIDTGTSHGPTSPGLFRLHVMRGRHVFICLYLHLDSTFYHSRSETATKKSVSQTHSRKDLLSPRILCGTYRRYDLSTDL